MSLGLVDRRAVLLIGAIALAGCQQWGAADAARPPPEPAPSMTTADAAAVLRDVERCGRSLGVAVRCNLLADQADFVLLRRSALESLGARHAPALSGQLLTTRFDRATIDVIAGLETCDVGAEDLLAVERGVEDGLRQCVAPTQ